MNMWPNLFRRVARWDPLICVWKIEIISNGWFVVKVLVNKSLSHRWWFHKTRHSKPPDWCKVIKVNLVETTVSANLMVDQHFSSSNGQKTGGIPHFHTRPNQFCWSYHQIFHPTYHPQLWLVIPPQYLSMIHRLSPKCWCSNPHMLVDLP